ncbi:RDD family protein [Streptomyces sp. enrichment culture]|uniref:RDD family protein n=1 Tax=Streptomyces sp. enrichment culture TaxID=1795815 RepID=UPI003F544CBB
MSAPTPAPGDDRPREGYYPDPSIPGYVRYWNGAAWVPGTSRPAPEDGESLAPPPGVRPAQPSVEETGPHFFDEDPVDGPAASAAPSAASSPAEAQHGSRPEPASAWGADRSRQSGLGGDQDRRISWGADPRVPHAPAAGTAPEGTGADRPEAGAAAPDGTFVFRRPAAEPHRAADARAGASGAVPGDEGTMTFRAVGPRTGAPGGGPATPGTGAPGAAGAGGPGVGPQAGSAPFGGPGFGAGKAAAARAAADRAGGAGPAAAAAPTAPSGPQRVAPAVPPQTAPAPPPAAPVAPAAPGGAPLTSGPGGGQASWAQQVHRLAGGEEPPVAPWKPPVEDPFQAAARRQAAARPAALGRRLAARLLDTVVLGGVTAVAAVPLGLEAVDHINAKIDAAKLSGETVTVWLLDGTTSVHLGIVLAVLLLAGVLYEVLPTVKWGRTLGKKLMGLEVRDIEGHEAPQFGAALRRWLVYSVPGLLVVGVVGVLWCLFDKPWRQCWHDKAAHTFVAG